MKIIIKYFSFLFLVAGFVAPANAQWKTEIFALEEGWNAIYTHIDASALKAMLNACRNMMVSFQWSFTKP